MQCAIAYLFRLQINNLHHLTKFQRYLQYATVSQIRTHYDADEGSHRRHAVNFLQAAACKIRPAYFAEVVSGSICSCRRVTTEK